MVRIFGKVFLIYSLIFISVCLIFNVSSYLPLEYSGTASGSTTYICEGDPLYCFPYGGTTTTSASENYQGKLTGVDWEARPQSWPYSQYINWISHSKWDAHKSISVNTNSEQGSYSQSGDLDCAGGSCDEGICYNYNNNPQCSNSRRVACALDSGCDFCFNEDILYEQTCNDNKLKIEEINCNNGCSAGKCI